MKTFTLLKNSTLTSKSLRGILKDITDQETEDLFQKIDTFFAPDQLKHQVMAIFGSAGSGKSIALQLKFIEAIQNWVKRSAFTSLF